MQDVQPLRGVIRFGVFEVDVRAGELRKQGVKIKLQEQPFQILQILLQRPGELVTREELQKHIWHADTFVDFDHGLYSAVKKLREALGDTAETPRFIETLPRRGYRFIGSVNGNGGVSVVPAREAPPVATTAIVRRRWRRTLIASLLAAGAAAGLVLTVAPSSVSEKLRRWLLVESSPPPIHSLAVLPLQNLSGDAAQEYFADGMTEELITVLSRMSGLKVISRTSIMRYKKTDKPLPEIARELNVDAIVEGSVLRAGDRVRITAQLIYARKDTSLWAETYDRDLQDVFGLQSAVASAIADEIRVKMTPTEKALVKASRPVNFTVLGAYLQGNYHLSRQGKGFGDEERKAAIEYFQRAIDADPNFAPAYIGMASAHDSLLLTTPEDTRIKKASSEKAVALDPASAEAHIALGNVRFSDWDWLRAEEEFRRAIALDPNSASAHGWLGLFLSAMGRTDEAMHETELAQELDPGEDHLSGILEFRGQYDRAIELHQRMLESHPDDGYEHFFLSDAYARKGADNQSLQELEHGLSLFGYKEVAARLNHAFTTSGYESALHLWAAELENLHTTHTVFLPVMLANVYVRLGDRDRAFYWLEQAYAHGDSIGADGGLVWLKADRVYDPIRSDPRFKDLVRRVGLPT